MDALTLGWFLAAALLLPFALWLIVDGLLGLRRERALRRRIAAARADVEAHVLRSRVDALVGSLVIAVAGALAAAAVRRLFGRVEK